MDSTDCGRMDANMRHNISYGTSFSAVSFTCTISQEGCFGPNVYTQSKINVLSERLYPVRRRTDFANLEWLAKKKKTDAHTKLCNSEQTPMSEMFITQVYMTRGGFFMSICDTALT